MFSRHPSRPALPVPDPGRLRFTDPAVPLRACCCPARPAVKVVLPARSGRDHPVDLWLCRHHYRASAAALLAAGASAEDIAFTGDSGPRDHVTVPA